MNETHPSYFELDRAALGVAPESTLEHVRGCDRCRAHLASVAPMRGDVVLPRRRVHTWRPVRVLGATTAALAVAAGVLLAIRTNDAPVAPEPSYTTERGAPAVGVFVHGEQGVHLWDGTSPISEGDSLRLKVVADGYRYVAVYSGAPGGSLTRLYRGTLDPDGETVLPPAWRVDGVGDAESLVVVLDHSPIEETTSVAVPRDGRWVAPLRIAKVRGEHR